MSVNRKAPLSPITMNCLVEARKGLHAASGSFNTARSTLFVLQAACSLEN